MKPKKSLGQNFLTSIPARIAIVKAGNLTSNDVVLEIGPGKGFLTEEILKTGAKVIAVEKDRELIPYLEEKFAKEISSKQLSLIEEDILEFNPKSYKLKAKGYKLVANIPYYITGFILSKFLSEKIKPSTMVVLVQKEVGNRVEAKDKKESILSLSVKVYGEPKVVYKVSRGSFFPVPNVDSCVLKIENISNRNFKNTKEEERFFEVVKLGLSHKRKKLISNLKEKFNEQDLKNSFGKLKLDEKVRGEDLSVNDFISLSKEL